MIERYETASMRAIWDADATLARWTRIELAACAAWYNRGIIDTADMETITKQAKSPHTAQVKKLEETTQHDVVAFVQALAQSIGPAGRYIHRGLTSSDVVDTALALGLVESLKLIQTAVHALRECIGNLAKLHQQTLCVGRTHGVHAEPTTFGLRLAGWYSELQRQQVRILQATQEIAVGKLSGAVGTFSQTDPTFEHDVLQALGLEAEPVATQVVPRDRHAVVFQTLGLLGASIERFALEIRHLQRTDVREVEEPFQTGQTGSSAMPHKRNPIISERLCGMARLLRGYVVAALENVALWHDRDISHSCVERVAFPDAFHLVHHMLQSFTSLVKNMRIYPNVMQQNLNKTRGLVFSQRVLGALLEHGLDRQAAYALVQTAAMQVWEHDSLTFQEALWTQDLVQQIWTRKHLEVLCDVQHYTKHVGTLFARVGLSA